MLGRRKETISTGTLPEGWRIDIERLNIFVEAPLEMPEEFRNELPAPILLVSAPGAVGKSTLAREVAAQTGAVLVDLAQAGAVGAGTVSGGLAWAGLFERFRHGSVALVIDGLDEARIRVTQDSFVAFLKDIYAFVNQADANTKPVTLFGRTSAIDDAWLHFADLGLEPPVLEIQFHRPEAALEFVVRRIASQRQERGQDANSVTDADRTAAEHILVGLRNQAPTDGNRFAGYAPVLIAVSERVAAEHNPHALVQDLRDGAEVLSLVRIVDAILERERVKLDQLELKDGGLKGKLYGKGEQVERLISAVYGIGHVPTMAVMNQDDATTYQNALDSWVPDHPFTDGTGTAPSSEVFGGFIAAEALRKEWAAETVRTKELGSAKVNPFIWRFRLPDSWLGTDTTESESKPKVQLVDLGLLFVSLQAGLTRSESAHLFIDSEGVQGHWADVEITRYFDGGMKWLALKADHDGTVYFGGRINDVDISGGELRVVTSGTETMLVAPVDIDVGIIDAGGSRIVVEGPQRRMDAAAAVRLRCSAFSWNGTTPFVRPGVDLAVDWPGSEAFPWHSYRKPDVPEGISDQLGERLRRLRRILMLFRSRGKGQLAKVKRAIDHERRIQGSGGAVRNRLLAEGVLVEDGHLYVLDTSKLSEVLGLTFLDVRSATVNDQTIAFLERVSS